MNISDYLKINKISSRQFAKQLGVSKSTVAKWRLNKNLYEHRRPEWSTMLKITKITKGKVSFGDWT